MVKRVWQLEAQVVAVFAGLALAQVVLSVIEAFFRRCTAQRGREKETQICFVIE